MLEQVAKGNVAGSRLQAMELECPVKNGHQHTGPTAMAQKVCNVTHVRQRQCTEQLCR